MQPLADNHEIHTIERALRFVEARLKSRPATAPMVEPVREVRLALTEAHDDWLEAKTAREAASAELRYADARLDRTVQSFFVQATQVIEGEEPEDHYHRLLPDQALEESYQDNTAFISSLLERLEADEDYTRFAQFIARIQGGLNDVERAEQVLGNLYEREARAFADRGQVIENARRAYNRLPSRLTLLLGGDKLLVESYFARLRKEESPKRDHLDERR